MSAGTVARVVTIVTGLWLMAAPVILAYGRPASASDRSVGPLAVSMGLIALWQATRGVRWVGLLLGAWAIAAPWLLGFGGAALASGTGAGIALIGCAFLRGEIEQRYGGGWRAIGAKGREADDS